jgi:DNA-binding transcriptional LysR family regulator
MRRAGLIELEAVLAVARRRSFRAAAAEVGLSTTALSQAVAGLEARLGVRLFNRTTRSVSPTAAGEDFIAQVAPALGEIREAMEAVNSHRRTPAGSLRLNMAAGAARQIFAPVILEYLRRYPEMQVDLVTEGRLIDIVRDGFDAGVRLADTVPGDMIAVPIGPDQRMVVVGAPAYLEGRTPPRAPQDLLAHDCIRSRFPDGALYRWEFERNGEALAVDVRGRLTLNESTLIHAAALAGFGLAHVTLWQAAEDIAAGRLVQLLEDWTPPFPGLCLYYPGRRHVPAGLRALIELIRELNGAW